MTTASRELDPSRSARDLYSVELRRQRNLAGLSLDRLADIVNYSKTHLHGVETAERLPYPPLSAKLDAAFGTGELFDGLWRIIQRERFPDRYRRFMELADQATDIHEYAGHLVPGLLQTPAYARALLRVGDPEGAAGEIERKVELRMGRQGRLQEEDGPCLWAVLEECVLRRPVGGPEVMHDQLAVLLRWMESPRIHIQIIPDAHGEHALLDSTMTLLTMADHKTYAYLESNYSGQLIEDPAEAMARRRAYDLVRAFALTPRDSAAMIKAAMEGYSPCEQHRTD